MCISPAFHRDPEWQSEDHPGAFLQPVPLQAAAAATAAVLSVPRGTPAAGRTAGHWGGATKLPQVTGNAVEVDVIPVCYLSLLSPRTD